jgi:HEAT repeat protein
MKSADSIVRKSAAYALGQLQAKEAVPELIALLKDETYGLRKSAAYALEQ